MARGVDRRDGREASKAFAKKADADRHGSLRKLTRPAASLIHPKAARTTVGQWCDSWLTGYATRRPSTVPQAQSPRRADQGRVRFDAARRRPPVSCEGVDVALLAEGLSAELRVRAARPPVAIMSDAVHDGILPKSPCSRRTSPGAGLQRPYVATTEQVWALHDAMPARLRAAVLLAAFAGLRSRRGVRAARRRRRLHAQHHPPSRAVPGR